MLSNDVNKCAYIMMYLGEGGFEGGDKEKKFSGGDFNPDFSGEGGFGRRGAKDGYRGGESQRS
jgi:hypothetical protein